MSGVVKVYHQYIFFSNTPNAEVMLLRNCFCTLKLISIKVFTWVN